jgi:hypothetical protein
MSVGAYIRERFFESRPLRLGPDKRGIESVKRVWEALIVPEKDRRSAGQSPGRRSRCEIERFFGGGSCKEFGSVQLKGLILCEKHALEVKLEEQIACWRGMLFHVDLWSREAVRQGRSDVVRLLEGQRARATSASQRACADLDRARSSGSGVPTENGAPTENRESPTGHPLRALRAKGVRPLSRGRRRR